MATTTVLPPSDVDSYDYVIVGGGTAGCVIASRLAEYLPSKRILLIEAGPSDFMDDRVLKLKDWLSLLGGDLDYDYPTTEQPMGSTSHSLSCIAARMAQANISQATATSDTRAPKCSVAARRTTRSSPSGPSSTTVASGSRWAAAAGRSTCSRA